MKKRGALVFAQVTASLGLAFACESSSSGDDGGGGAGTGGLRGGAGGAVGGVSAGAMSAGGTTAGGAAGGSSPRGGAAGANGLGGTVVGGAAGEGGEGGESEGGVPGMSGAGGLPVAGSGPIAGTGGTGLGLCTFESSGEPRDYTVQGCLVEGSGTKPTISFGATPVTVVSVGTASAASSCTTDTTFTTAIRLRAADSREWTYFVYVPNRPVDHIAVNDALELTYSAHNNFFNDQTVVLGRGGRLAVFTVVSWLAAAPNLSAYGTTVAVGAASCITSGGICGPTRYFPLLVTHGTASAQVETLQTKLVGDLSVSLQHLWMGTSQTCDPPTSYRYGGFTPREP